MHVNSPIKESTTRFSLSFYMIFYEKNHFSSSRGPPPRSLCGFVLFRMQTRSYLDSELLHFWKSCEYLELAYSRVFNGIIQL